MYRVLYTSEARDNIAKLEPKKKHQIKDAVERIANDPKVGKQLTQRLAGIWSYRSGDYRIIYKTYQEKVLIIVLAVGHRKEIYKQISRKFS